MFNPNDVSHPWTLRQSFSVDSFDGIVLENVWGHLYQNEVIIHFRTDPQSDVNHHVEVHPSETAAQERLQSVGEELKDDTPTSVNGISLLTGGGSDFDLGTFPSKSDAIEKVIEYSEENS